MKKGILEKKVSIIGAGSWGTTLAVIFSQKGIGVNLHSVFKEHNFAMQKDGENRLFLKGSLFPPGLSINPSLSDTLNSKVVLLAVPVQYMRAVLKNIAKEQVRLSGHEVFVSVAKGIEQKTLKRPAELKQEELGDVKIAV